MYLRSVRLRGFKTFPDQAEIRLEPGVAVVVGPNGSGKSNIADAVVWAAGSLSPSELRAEKPDDVLFAGSSTRPPSDFCSVELVFENSDGAGPLPFAELSVARRLERGGEGQYLVNGAHVRRTDLVELLADIGLGGELHSVIGQGRVEQVLGSKPADRRALVEEAAGLGRFKRRRRRAELKLARVAEQVERVRDLEVEVRKRLRPLALQATAAARAEKLAVEIARIHARLDAADLDRIERRLAEVEERRSAALHERRRCDERLTGVLEERRRAEEELSEAAGRHEQATAALYRVRTALERVELRRERAEETARAIRAELARPRLPLSPEEPSYERVIAAATRWKARSVDTLFDAATLLGDARREGVDAVVALAGPSIWYSAASEARIDASAEEASRLPALADAAGRLAEVLAAAARAVRRFEPALAARVGAGGSTSGQVTERLREVGAREADLRRAAGEAGERLTAISIDAARLEREREELVARLPARQEREPLGDAEADELRSHVARLERRREALGQVNPLAAEEHARESERLRELAVQREDLERSLAELEKLRADLSATVERRFAETYGRVERHFSEVVGTLFPGGRGRLFQTEADEGEDPGIEIELRPAGKRVTRLSLLSGGEKALGAISFLFALFLARPCPFYLLDEVEAALDDTNIGRFVELLRRFSDRAQFIVVTHQKRTIEAADILYGVTMGADGVSQVVSKRLGPKRAAAA
ncbi:MAG: AAA family ATPase [Thermoleophilia bacterium]|nr:AAA family ATPase [Thermoleophilia bacterium]